METSKQPKNTLVVQVEAKDLNHEKVLESSKILAIFPTEIWLPILQNIFQPKDLFHLKTASGFFEKLLPDLKTKRLFPDVIKIFATKFGWKDNKTREVMLKCRSVCRTWQIGVDSVLRSYFNHRKLLYLDHIPYYTLFRPISIGLWNSADTMKFLQHFDEVYASKNRNPLICGSIFIDYDNQRDDFVSYIRDIRHILHLYGHNILHFNAYVQNPDVSCYETLAEFLHFTKNLKELVIECTVIEYSDDEFKALSLNMQIIMFPILPSLQHLQLLNLPRPVFVAFLRNYSPVPVLTTCSDTSRTNTALYALKLPNLAQLELSIDSNEMLTRLERSNVMWPLTALRIRVGTIKLDWEKLFQLLENRWAATLTGLHIIVAKDGADRADRSMQIFPSLNLPKLKVFMFSTFDFVPLDFILPMSNSLELLRVWYNFSEAAEFDVNEKYIQLYSVCSNLANSNIWALFSKLKFVEYYDRHVKLRQRSRYELKCKARKLSGKNVFFSYVIVVCLLLILCQSYINQFPFLGVYVDWALSIYVVFELIFEFCIDVYLRRVRCGGNIP